jgi:hypothetical protein
MAEPTVRSILLGGLPLFLREGFLPVAAFWAGQRLGGLAVGIAASSAVSLAIYVAGRRVRRDGLLVRVSLLFVVAQAAVGLVARSATVYLAAPVLGTALWGLVFLGSAALGRPLAGTLACAWYPFTAEERRSEAFRRVYAVESVVWGLFLLARSALRLAALLYGGVGGFLLVVVLTGTPATLALLVWSIWYALRRLSDDEHEPAGPLARRAPLADAACSRPWRAG